ncbi:MAG: hypothetical protein CM15mP36_01620 [Flavobacteriales bacterium]|nr:MAG: hypothetical protein CM15mP36_01620 [Flavobacteriales bacterium]
MHAGIGDDSSPWGYSVIGNWGQDDGVGQMSDNGDGTWSITIVPEDFFGNLKHLKHFPNNFFNGI